MQDPNQLDLSPRVSGLERDVAHLDDRLDGFEKTVSRRFDQLAYSIENLSDTISESGRTPWGTLAGWAAVVVMLVGILGHGYVRDLNRIELEHSTLQKIYYQHVLQSTAETASLKAQLKALQSRK